MYLDVPTAGHLGIDKTLEKIKQHFYWPSMKDYVTKYCNSCDSCAARKPSRSRNKAPLGKYVVGFNNGVFTRDLIPFWFI
jgi:hypothetical protein